MAIMNHSSHLQPMWCCPSHVVLLVNTNGDECQTPMVMSAKHHTIRCQCRINLLFSP